MQAAVAVLSATGAGQDRAVAIPTPSGYVLAVADGAGNRNGPAADHLIALVTPLADKASTTDWFAVLCKFDDELAKLGSGETTGVAVFVQGSRVVGASVGDSSAWLISPSGKMTDLTHLQRRRPLLGSGEALPVQFEAGLDGGRLLLASDGLIKYATVDQVCAFAMQGSIEEAADALANCVRLASGTIQDDVAVVVLTADTN